MTEQKHYYPAKCDRCGKLEPSTDRRHMGTQYVDEESNYCFECDECYEKTLEYWDEMFREYYGGLL